MKSFLSLLFVAASTVSVSAHAIGLESFYGTTVQRGNTYTCVYENNTGATQSMKYVVFSFEAHGDGGDIVVQDRIDKVVAPGETVRASTEHFMSGRNNFCKYLARR